MYKTISMAEFVNIYEQGGAENILDVREIDEFEDGHIPGAVSLPLSEFPLEPEKGKEYYVFCQSGGRSAMACQFLAAKGHTVVNVMGGMGAWAGETK